MKKTLLVLAMAGALACSPALAWRVVFDPTNYTQNVMTAARSLEQINNQIRQLQNETQMLTNQGLNLAGLDYSALASLRSSLATTNQLIQQAQGLARTVTQMDSEFERLYPKSFEASVSSNQMSLDARERWQQSLSALQAATRIQAQAVQNFSADESTLTELVNRSQSASGALQAAQATNQLLALQARQSIQAQQLQLSQDRAQALELARQAAVVEQAREVRRRFRGSGTPYTPYTVDFYSE